MLFCRTVLAPLLLALFASSGAATRAQGAPDAIIGDITGPANHPASGSHDAFTLGTTTCNVGTANLTWVATSNQHPVFGGTLYKYAPSSNGRFIMIGRSWLKHGTTAAQQTLCSSCANSGTFSALGVGCSDPSGSSYNSQQAVLGPRSDVDPSTGAFPFPPSSPPWSGSTDRRLKVPVALLDTTSTYVAEAQVVQWEDAAAGNDDNNASYRLASISGGPSNYGLAFDAPTVRGEPGITAWAALDPRVSLQTLHVPGPGGGKLTLGVRRTENGDGTWHFETCVHNLNSHDAVSGVTFNFANGVTITNQGFHAPEWHSNSVYNNNAWTSSRTPSAGTWLVDGSPAGAANVIRWSTAFSFWFDSDDPDILSTTLDLYASGSTVTLPASVFPPESWQSNSDDAHFDIDGYAANDPYMGPIQLSLPAGAVHTANFNGTSGQPFELFLTSVPATPLFYATVGGEIVNLELYHSSFFGYFGTPVMPSGGLSLPFTYPSGGFYAGQLWSANPASADGFNLSAATELALVTLPRVTVECVGPNSFSTTADGFWRVTHHYGASISDVTWSFQGVAGLAGSLYFDTDQSMPGGGAFSQGATYRQGSNIATGLDYSASTPFAGSGWAGSDGLGGADFQTVGFHFAGGLFNGQTFRFDADTDAGTHGALSHVGMAITVTLSTGEILSGTLSPGNGLRAFVDFP